MLCSNPNPLGNPTRARIERAAAEKLDRQVEAVVTAIVPAGDSFVYARQHYTKIVRDALVKAGA